MALTRPNYNNLNSNVEVFNDPITLLNGGAVSDDDVGILINRANGLIPNVALYFNETTQSFVTAYTYDNGMVNANINVVNYAPITVGAVYTTNGLFWQGNGEVVGSSTYSDANVAAILSGDITIGGNLIVLGNTVTVNSETITGSEVVAGNLVANSGINSTSVNTGAVVVVGGAGISGNVFAGNVFADGFFYSNGMAFVSGGGSVSAGDYLISGNTQLTVTPGNVTVNIGGNIVMSITANGLEMNGHTISGLPLPLTGDQAANKDYVDAAVTASLNVFPTGDYGTLGNVSVTDSFGVTITPFVQYDMLTNPSASMYYLDLETTVAGPDYVPANPI